MDDRIPPLPAHWKRPVVEWRNARANARALATWEDEGRADSPPSAYKHQLLRERRRRHGLQVLVETGTYLGDTIAALRSEFREVTSIELSPALHACAVSRFSTAKNVSLLEGESGEVLATLVPTLDETALFWLDGHFSDGIHGPWRVRDSGS